MAHLQKEPLDLPPRCPLCAQSSHELLEIIRYEDIRYIYRRICGIAIPPENVADIRYFRCASCDLRYFVPAVCGEADFYERLQQQVPSYYLAEKAEYGIAGKFVSADASVLEIGCGMGSFRDFLPAACAYRALEFNDEAIRKTRARGLRVDRMTVEELARSDSSRYDVVCSFQVLEHVSSPATFFASAVSLLNAGGRLIVSVPSEDSFMKDELNNVLNTPPHHVTRWSDAALASAGRLLGLQLEHLEHEKLSSLHAAAYAKACVVKFMRNRFGLRLPSVSRAAASFLGRSALYMLALPVTWMHRVRPVEAAGHSVVAIYRKP